MERGEIYVHNGLEGLVVIVLSRDQTIDSCAVYKNVHSAEETLYGAEHLICAFCIGQIAGKR